MVKPHANVLCGSTCLIGTTLAGLRLWPAHPEVRANQSAPIRLLKYLFLSRLLKKVQTTHPTDGYPAARDARCEAYLVRTS